MLTQGAEQALREEILVEIGQQLAGFQRATGRVWRIGDVEFGVETTPDFERLRTRKGAYREPGDEDAGVASQTGAERITLIAAVVLKSAPTP
jgi:hypothetical protein